MRTALVLALAFLVAPSAHAGRKKRDEPPKSQPVEEPPADIAIGRPAGMDFLELPCPYTTGSTHAWRRTKVHKGITTVSTITATVTAMDATQVDMDLAIVSESVAGEEGTAKQVQEAMAAVGGTPKIRFHIPSATVQLLNHDELQPAYAAAGKALAETLQAGGMPSVTATSATRDFQVVAQLEKRLTGDLAPLFTNTCGSFPLQASTYEAEVASPTDGSPLPANGRMATDRVNPTLVRFTTEQTVSPEALVPVVAQMLQKMGKPEQAPEAILAQLQAPGGGVVHRMVADVDTVKGQVITATTTDTMKLADMDRAESVTFESIP